MGRRRKESHLTDDYSRQRVAVPSLLPRRWFQTPSNFLRQRHTSQEANMNSDEHKRLSGRSFFFLFPSCLQRHWEVFRTVRR